MSKPFVDAFFPLYNFSFFVKNQVFIGVWINIWVFNSIPMVDLSVFMPVPSCFHFCSSIIELEAKDGDPFKSSFIVQDYFGCPGFFVFPYEVEYCSLKDCKKLCWDFDGNCIEAIDCYW